MNKKLLLTSFFLYSVCYLASGQSVEKIYHTDKQFWVGYFNQTRITNKFGVWLDLHFRTGDNFFGKPTQAIFRPGLTYYVSDRLRLTAGYSYVNHFGAKGHEDFSVPEHRPWQQVQWTQKYTRLNTMQWIRLEERYRRKYNSEELKDNYNFNYRIRYNLALFVPLTSKTIEPKTLFLFLNDEVHINFGKEIINNYFDQNRAFIGLGYQLDSHSHIQLGYMNVFQQLPKGNEYNSNHAIRLFLFHNLDFRSSEPH